MAGIIDIPHEGRSACDGTAIEAARLEQFGYKCELRRGLGFFDSFAVQFSMISLSGTIFLMFKWGLVTIGPVFFCAWLIGAVLQVSVGLSIAELASAYPLAGSCYNWVRRLHSNSLAWIVGYVLVIAHLSALVVVDYDAAPYLLNFAGVSNPTAAQVIVVAVACLLAQTLINLMSVTVAVLVNNVRVMVEIAAISLLVIALLILGLRQSPAILFHFAGTSVHEHVPPFLLVLLGPASVISSFDSSGNVAEEMKNPTHDVPRGLTTANLAAFVYGAALVAVPLLAMTNLARTISAPAPLLYIMQTRLGFASATLIEAVVITSLCMTGIMLQLTAARIIWAQARDGALPGAGWLRSLNGAGVPARAAVLCAVVAAIFLFWSQALWLLSALGSEAWAAVYGVTVAVSLRAKLKERLPRNRGWNLGKWGIANDIAALVWSGVLVLLLPLGDIVHVLGGFIGAVGLGGLLYGLWVRPRWNPPWNSVPLIDRHV